MVCWRESSHSVRVDVRRTVGGSPGSFHVVGLFRMFSHKRSARSRQSRQGPRGDTSLHLVFSPETLTPLYKTNTAAGGDKRPPIFEDDALKGTKAVSTYTEHTTLSHDYASLARPRWVICDIYRPERQRTFPPYRSASSSNDVHCKSGCQIEGRCFNITAHITVYCTHTPPAY